MQCPYCKEQVIEGAKICPHCRKDQPAEAARKSANRWAVAGVCTIGVIALFVLSSVLYANNRADECRRATMINQTITQDQCMQLVEKYGDSALHLIAPAMDH